MDRLLSEQEIMIHKQDYINLANGQFILSNYLDFILKRQLAKTDAEWVERMEKYGDSCKCGFCSYRIPNCYPANMSCFLWQQLKKNMGAK